MMRYRVSPDCVPLSNGRKHSLRACKEEDADNGVRTPNFSPLEGKPFRRSGSGSTAHQDHHFSHVSFPSDPSHSENQPPSSSSSAAAASTPSPVKAQSHHHEINGVSPGGGEVLLQWGHNKRSRGSRAESRGAAGDDSSAHSRVKIQRRSAAAGSEKLAAAAASAAMPPPCGSYTRGANLRPCLPTRDTMTSSFNRGVEDRSGGLSRSDKRSPPSPPEKAHRTAPNGTATDANPAGSKPPSDQETGGSNAAAPTVEKLNLEHFEWPRIYISLSRKEKEDDFLAMKGTKLPQRPKKRAKNIDKALQYCFPGMWLSDLTRGRYEVREKKCVKKKRRGLKGMESMDSDSE
ncbi:trinucleotide repeat-containing gene 18 protein-like isoform X2 [Phoenix dactylifera]|uniref:Trinucleotide repeat-containing gene 18 protein-like isoform X2 n=1 Tax=Phoenix dactylifera TaxID=42345 RepID=A0A8B7CI48_PHODC|nr:trinucleotide repeat-containing gene 18 protein-like isoform X2 [Phoenix dactylifera]